MLAVPGSALSLWKLSHSIFCRTAGGEGDLDGIFLLLFSVIITFRVCCFFLCLKRLLVLLHFVALSCHKWCFWLWFYEQVKSTSPCYISFLTVSILSQHVENMQKYATSSTIGLHVSLVSTVTWHRPAMSVWLFESATTNILYIILLAIFFKGIEVPWKCLNFTLHELYSCTNSGSV